MSRTLAEQEVTFRWDMEEHVLWAGTTVPWVAAKWERNGQPVRILSRERDGTPCSWEVKLPWTGKRKPWSALFQQSLSSSSTLASTPVESPEVTPNGRDDSDEP